MTPSRVSAPVITLILFAATVGTATCGVSPNGGSGAAPSPLAATPLRTVSTAGPHATLARCLQGDGPSGCFDATSTDAARIVAAAVAPGAPALAAFSSGSSVFLNWIFSIYGDQPTSYIIEAGSASGLANLANFSTGNALWSYSTDGVAAGTYYVRVRAVNAGGVSAPSNEVRLVVAGAAGGCAGPPTGLRLLTQDAIRSAIEFSWAPPSSGTPTSYTIEAGSAPGQSNLANLDTGNTSNVFSASGVGNGTYYVRVRSRSSCGLSAPSNEIVIVVGSSTPTTPCAPSRRGGGC